MSKLQEKITKGWVLRIYDKEDNTSLVTIFSQEGYILNLKALGIQKVDSKNRNSLQIFSFVEIEYFQSSNLNTGRLKKAHLIKQISPVNTLEFNVLSFIKNVIIPYKEVDPKIYKTLEFILEDIKFSVFNMQYIFYILRLIIEQENYKIVVDKCALCGSKQNISSFSLKEGGLLCSNCLSSFDKPINAEFLKKIIKLFSIKEIKQLQSVQFDPAEEKMLKSIFGHFLSANLGLYSTLLEKI